MAVDEILPFGSVAWRVEVGESFAAAMACGLVGLMVSRGSSMLIEGIEELKEMNRKWEGAICAVCGITAGLMLGFDNFMWRESVVINRISVFDVPWLMVVAVCLMRWIYAPHQRRYLYIAMFFFGVCATIHQTMLCAAMGIEVAIAVAHPKLGRTFFLANSFFYLCILLLKTVIPAFQGLAPTLEFLLHAVGVASIVAYIWLAIFTKETFNEFCRDGALAASFLFVAAAATPSQASACLFLALVAFVGFIILAVKTWRIDHGWLVGLVCLILYSIGVAFYFYEPIAGMTDPPMQWGYPRTVEGFFHALSRGQYEKANPTDVMHDPTRFIMQLGMLAFGLAGSFSWVFLFVAVLPFFFLLKMQRRERAWIIGLAAMYFCVGILLTVLMNTTPDRQSAEENKVFFTASHAVVAIMIGYGLALLLTYMATHYARFRFWGIWGGAVAAVLGLFGLWQATGMHYFGPAGEISPFELPHWIAVAFGKDQYSLPIFAHLILAALPFIFIAALLIHRQRAPILITLCIFAAMPVYSGLAHWAKGEQRNHWFGYWFGHDMFTPPFVGPDGQFSYDAKLREQMMKDPKTGNLVYPEMDAQHHPLRRHRPRPVLPDLHDFLRKFRPAEGQADGPGFRPPRRLSHHAKRAGRRHLSGLSPRAIFPQRATRPAVLQPFFKYCVALAGMVPPEASRRRATTSAAAILEARRSRALPICLMSPWTSRSRSAARKLKRAGARKAFIRQTKFTSRRRRIPKKVSAITPRTPPPATGKAARNRARTCRWIPSAARCRSPARLP